MTEATLNLLPWPATFSDGSSTQVIAYDATAHALTLVCSRAEPPGRPLALRTRVGEEELALHGRSGGSKLREDGKFTVVMRLVSLRKNERARARVGIGSEETGDRRIVRRRIAVQHHEAHLRMLLSPRLTSSSVVLSNVHSTSTTSPFSSRPHRSDTRSACRSRSRRRAARPYPRLELSRDTLHVDTELVHVRLDREQRRVLRHRAGAADGRRFVRR